MIWIGLLLAMAPQGELEKMYIPPLPTSNGFETLLKAYDLAKVDPRIRDLAAHQVGVKLSDSQARKDLPALNRILALQAESLSKPYDLSRIIRQPAPNRPEYVSRVDEFVWNAEEQLSRAVARAAEYWFENGNSAKATNALLLQLKTSRLTMPASANAMVFAMTSDTNIYSAFDRHLSRLSLKDVETILEVPLPVPTSTYGKAIINDTGREMEVLDGMPGQIEADLHKSIPEEDAMWKQFLEKERAMTRAQRQVQFDGWKKQIIEGRRAAAAILAAPEHSWPFDGFHFPEGEHSHGFLTDVDDMESNFVSIARSRTEARLLRLSAQLQKFRLQHHRLPKGLAELKLPRSETFDPLSNHQFVYRPSGPDLVMSPGVRKTGPVITRTSLFWEPIF